MSCCEQARGLDLPAKQGGREGGRRRRKQQTSNCGLAAKPWPRLLLNTTHHTNHSQTHTTHIYAQSVPRICLVAKGRGLVWACWLLLLLLHAGHLLLAPGTHSATHARRTHRQTQAPFSLFAWLPCPGVEPAGAARLFEFSGVSASASSSSCPPCGCEYPPCLSLDEAPEPPHAHASVVVVSVAFGLSPLLLPLLFSTIIVLTSSSSHSHSSSSRPTITYIGKQL